MSNDIVLYGFLRTCIDKRFVAKSREAFEAATGLKPDENQDYYWHEAYAGGSAKDPSPAVTDLKTGKNTYADEYAADHGATIFGWQAHINKCGGLPDADNLDIARALDEHISAMIKKYPNFQHYRLLASDEGITIVRVHPYP